MVYLTYDEFLAYGLGAEVSEDEFGPLERYAEEIINQSTFDRVAQFDEIPQEVRKATALQVAYMAQNGGLDLALSAGGYTGETIGGYSYAAGSSGRTGGDVVSPKILCPLARGALLPTGLMYRGLGGCCR